MLSNFSEKTLFIFDFDGVIADSVNVKTKAFAELYSEFGERIVDQVIDFHLRNGGMSRYDKIRYFHTELVGNRVTDQLVRDWANRFADLVLESVIAAAEIPGIREVLDFCHHNKIVCAVNSATPESELFEIVKSRGLLDDFQMILGSPRSKADNLAYILKTFEINSTNAVFFGDARNDYIAAQREHVDFIGINYNSHTVEPFPVFKDFHDFLSIIHIFEVVE